MIGLLWPTVRQMLRTHFSRTTRAHSLIVFEVAAARLRSGSESDHGDAPDATLRLGWWTFLDRSEQVVRFCACIPPYTEQTGTIGSISDHPTAVMNAFPMGNSDLLHGILVVLPISPEIMIACTARQL